ncbi:putative effector protein [Ceratobasidium theobromae]|uniref:Putative effector protein n=1 Tax=Ceratobasidium theobromae TaxID=1582974 RepID=A0A5N5QQ30_9AGAM|nr:putative effector protein [Ceratobasidium theobromae]
MGFFASLLAWFQGLFFTKAAEISIVGLQASGKTSLVNVLTSGQWSEDVVPTVAFNLRKVRKGNVTFKIWDVAGMSRAHVLVAHKISSLNQVNQSLGICGRDIVMVWMPSCESHSHGINKSNSFARLKTDKLESAGFELHSLLDHQPLAGVPLLVLGNKNDLAEHAPVDELILQPSGNYPGPARVVLFGTCDSIEFTLY